MAVFVSRHNHSLNVTHDTIVSHLRSANMLSTYNSHGLEPYRTTPTHVVMAECPFCPKPTGGKADNMYKLYVATGSGAYYCHRCGGKGSWFDFCKRLGGGADGNKGGVDVVNARGKSGGATAGGGYEQQQTQQHRGGLSVPGQYSAAAGSSGSAGPYGQQRRSLRGDDSNVPGSNKYSQQTGCLPMPSKRLSAAYNTSLLDVRSSSNGDGANSDNGTISTTDTNNALHYLTTVRALDTKTLRKYGVGRGYYNFPSNNPNSSAKYVREECVTFPWIMRASEVHEQEELREPPGRFDWVDEEREDSSSSSSSGEVDGDGKNEAERKENDHDGEPPLEKATGPWITRRIKARSLNHKGHQRLDPPGGGWGLFGWHTVPADATSVVVTEGEYDAMAVYQATGRPAVSLPNGCRSLPLEVLPLLERFETIYLWMDNDGPGREGAEKFANKLGAKRCLIVTPKPDQVDPKTNKSPKDANDALRMGLDMNAMLESAEIMPHEQLLKFADFREQVLHEIINPDKYAGVGVTSLPVFTSIIKGFRRGEMTLLTGPTGSGKTTFLGQLSLDFAEQGVNTLWGSFEIKNTRLVSKLLQQFSREPLPIGQPDKLEDLRALSDRFEELPLHFLRFHGSADIDAVIEAMNYAAYVHDVEHIILDNMQFMISRDQMKIGGSSYDKFEMQDIAIAKFRKFATENNVHVTLVCHPRKEDEGVRLGISSVFGSAKATQEADTVLILQNDGKRKFIDVKKNRYDGTLGLAPLHFQRGSGRYTEKPEFDFSGVKETVSSASRKKPASGSATTAPTSAPPTKAAARQIATKAATANKAAPPKKKAVAAEEPSVDFDSRWSEILSD